VHDLDVLIELVRSDAHRPRAADFLRFLRRRRARQADTMLRRLSVFRPAPASETPSPGPRPVDSGRSAA
jgi:hypothetical protein